MSYYPSNQYTALESSPLFYLRQTLTLADVRSGKKSFVIDGTTTSPDIKALQTALQE